MNTIHFTFASQGEGISLQPRRIPRRYRLRNRGRSKGPTASAVRAETILLAKIAKMKTFTVN